MNDEALLFFTLGVFGACVTFYGAFKLSVKSKDTELHRALFSNVFLKNVKPYKYDKR
jgi:hypothetical protein